MKEFQRHRYPEREYVSPLFVTYDSLHPNSLRTTSINVIQSLNALSKPSPNKSPVLYRSPYLLLPKSYFSSNDSDTEVFVDFTIFRRSYQSQSWSFGPEIASDNGEGLEELHMTYFSPSRVKGFSKPIV